MTFECKLKYRDNSEHTLRYCWYASSKTYLIFLISGNVLMSVCSFCRWSRRICFSPMVSDVNAPPSGWLLDLFHSSWTGCDPLVTRHWKLTVSPSLTAAVRGRTDNTGFCPHTAMSKQHWRLSQSQHISTHDWMLYCKLHDVFEKNLFKKPKMADFM